MRNKDETIRELGALVEALCPDIDSGSRKTCAKIRFFPPNSCTIEEHFDDGKDHSGAFTCDTSPVDISIFEEAKGLSYITGRLMPGYVSTTEFVLTQNYLLREEIYKLISEWKKATPKK